MSKRIIICSRCGRERFHAAHGLCAPCNAMVHRQEHPGPVGICIDCGEETNIQAKGRCKKCYSRYHRKNASPEEKEKKEAGQGFGAVLMSNALLLTIINGMKIIKNGVRTISGSIVLIMKMY